LLDAFSEVMSPATITSMLRPAWDGYQRDRTIVKSGPSGPGKFVLTAITSASEDFAEASYCVYDDAVTVGAESGAIVNDSVVVDRGRVGFRLRDGRWQIVGMRDWMATPGTLDDPAVCAREALVS
jgi:hypothetical protein